MPLFCAVSAMYLFAFLIICIILCIYISKTKRGGLVSCAHETMGNSPPLFLNKEEASAVLKRYSICPRLSKRAILKNIEGFASAAEKQYLVNKCKNAIETMDFTPSEIKTLSGYLKNPSPSFIKIKNDFGYTRWFTVGDRYVVIPESELKGITEDYFLKVLRHEIEHLRQRAHMDEYRALYKQLGLIEVAPENIIITDEIIENPDDFECRHIYAINGEYYFPYIAFGAHKKFKLGLAKLARNNDNYIEVESWYITTAPTEIKEQIINIWRKHWPGFSMDDLEENGYSANEIMARMCE